MVYFKTYALPLCFCYCYVTVSFIDKIDESATKLRKDLIMIYDRWYDQKIYFNPVKEKLAKEVIFT